jgi:hypothetical protein
MIKYCDDLEYIYYCITNEMKKVGKKLVYTYENYPLTL